MARSPYINLDRRFRALSDEEREDPDSLARYNDQFYSALTDSWEKLLDHPRVVILAEAGSGKTREMREQAARMVADGACAFFLALEALQSERPQDLMSASEQKRFDAWLADDTVKAWFFLDSVDELKLVQGTLDKALRRLSREVEGRLDRLSVVLSSRPTDWRQSTDLEALETHLPLIERGDLDATSETLFFSALERDRGAPRAANSDARPYMVALLPLGERQVEAFLKHTGVPDVDGLLREIRLQDAWTFARRPLDLGELAAFWRTNGRLGTRSEQHEANIRAKLKDDPDRRDRHVLSEAKARVGAERLALALVLTRGRTIRAPDLAPRLEQHANVLDAADVLSDWSEEERQTLLRRALFDPATYGRVRFHHTSVQEYLAAQRLVELRKRGMTANALRRLLVGERYGVQVVFPSTKATAAWLSLLNDDILSVLMDREPEALLIQGDPGGFRMESRARLLRAFTRAYGKGGDRGINIPIDEVRRLAHIDLAPTITELWATPDLAPDVKELLLELIWQGAIKPCAEIAAAAAGDQTLPEYERIIAVRGLVACGRDNLIAPIVASMVTNRALWPAKVLFGVVEDLFPVHWSAAELRRLIARTPEPEHVVGGFSWSLRQLVPKLDPLAQSTTRLRNALAALIWKGRGDTDEWHQHSSRFSHVAIALAGLCARQVEAKIPITTALVKACVIAYRYGNDGYESREEVSHLKAIFAEQTQLRGTAFWIEVDLSSKRSPMADAGEIRFQAEHGSVIELRGQDDWPWLLVALQSAERPFRRAVALEELVRLWWRRGKPTSEMSAITRAVGGDASLTARLATHTSPAPANPRWAITKRKQRWNQVRALRKEKRRLKGWDTWRVEVLKDPIAQFQPPHLDQTLANLYIWLKQVNRGRSSLNAWDCGAIEGAFSKQIADLATAAFRAYWREDHVVPTSMRAPAEPTFKPRDWRLGLTGLAADAESDRDWAARLSRSEADTAASFSIGEYNSFPPWTEDLARSQPAAFDDIVDGALDAELSRADASDFLQVLQHLNYGPSAFKQIFASRIQSALMTWPAAPTDDNRLDRAAHHLSTALDIVIAVDDPTRRADLIAICKVGFQAAAGEGYALVWLKALMRLSGPEAAEAIEIFLGALPAAQADAYGVTLFASLFGDPGGTSLQADNPAGRVATLERLIRIAYRHIREADDQHHEGVYTSDERDLAQRGRSLLLNLLFETSGAEAQAEIIRLADDPLFADWPDRMRLIARRRAAADAEGVALTVGEVTTLEGRLEAPPHDRGTLYQTMLDRLSDLAHDVAHDDFSDRRTLRTIKDESEMQRTLAARLRESARGAYVVVREDEVADQKRTDIRLATTEHKAVIEIKLADYRWAFSDLETALRDQLVGRYLRHRSGRAGCLLLVYDGSKTEWRESGKRMSFEQVVNRLQEMAREIELQRGYELLVTVQGLDLRDPLTAV